MLFLGIDFGWRTGPSGLAVLTWDGEILRLQELTRETSLEAILAWVDSTVADQPAMIAIDAPTVIPNATGMRLPDKLTHRYFGRYHAGCYPANLGRPFAERTTALGAALEARGFRHSDQITPQTSGRYQIECFPHPAMVQLFGLARILKYKKGPLAARQLELARYCRLLTEDLPLITPHLETITLPMIPTTGKLFKELEDQLDGLMCAYVGAYWWYWGEARNQVLGDHKEGYIIVPQRLIKA